MVGQWLDSYSAVRLRWRQNLTEFNSTDPIEACCIRYSFSMSWRVGMCSHCHAIPVPNCKGMSSLVQLRAPTGRRPTPQSRRIFWPTLSQANFRPDPQISAYIVYLGSEAKCNRLHSRRNHRGTEHLMIQRDCTVASFRYCRN